MTPTQFVKLFQTHGSIRAIACVTGLSNRQVRKAYLVAVQEGLMEKLPIGRKTREAILHPPVPATEPAGRLRAIPTLARGIPEAGVVNRFLFTCAQNDTKLHEPFWRNLLVFAEHLNAEVHVSRFAYEKSGLGASGDKAGFTERPKGAKVRALAWDEALTPYLSDTRLAVAPGLVWCGEMNTLPTATRPLSGLEVYTGRRSGIFPHVKIAMESIASAAGEPTKFNYTTGAVTQRNYIQRKAGLKAEFHHCYGALLVEVDSDGDWFCRQINADSEGNFYDLDVRVCDGYIHAGFRVEAITWGDIHNAEKVNWVFDLNWREGGLLDTLRPKSQFFHDVLHFRGKSHHEIKNPHTMFKRYVQGFSNVRTELLKCNTFLRTARREWCKGYVVDSNHHHHLARWLQEQPGYADPENAQLWLGLNQAVLAHIKEGLSVDYLKIALAYTATLPLCDFLAPDESLVLCPDDHGGIEAGLHGDHGPNGARGSALNLSKIGRKANIGHSHSARIVDGVYQSGTCGTLQPDWTQGPNSWSHSHIVTYQNGKRAIITLWNKKWKAENGTQKESILSEPGPSAAAVHPNYKERKGNWDVC